MEENAITASTVNEIKNISPEEIAEVSKNVIEATNVTHRATEELDHLNACLADFTQTHDEYQKKAKIARDRMRYLSSHI